VQVDHLHIDLNGQPASVPRVYNIRAYSQAVSLSCQWLLNSTATTLSLTSTASRWNPEVFSTSGGNNFTYFLEIGGATVPGSRSEQAPYFSPMRYVRGGLETPLSYNIKVLNNQFWKSKYAHSASPFSLTEFDILPSGTIKRDDFTYLSFKLPDVPVFWPLSISAPAEVMYPYTYGIDIPNADGAVILQNSPFYVEKMAGVDSPGMLLSLLKILGLGTRTDAVVQTRYTTRTALSSYRQIVNSTAWSNYPANPSYFVQSDWFLRNSYAVTDAASIRPGDLVVGYEGSELNVGIIVGSDPSADQSNPLDKWLVVTINRATKRAIYARWSQMSVNPSAYHVRRLVVLGTSGSPASDSLSQVPTGQVSFLNYNPTLSYDLVRDDPDNFKQWIPNTNEFGYLGKITIKTSDGQDISSLLEDSSWEIGSVTKNSNVVKREKSTTFHLVALNAPQPEDGISLNLVSSSQAQSWEQNQYIDLFTIAPDTVVGDGSYVITAASGFDPTAWTLVVKNRSLAVQNISTPAIVFKYFAIYAENPSPGDDIALSFKFHSAFGLLSTDPASAIRLAVYDKKMLWRANLYIDEGAGNADWNNRHPWITRNEWNTGGDGKQIPILEFSSPRVQSGDSNDNVLKKSVAYDYPTNTKLVTKNATPPLPSGWISANISEQSADTPQQYNTEMAQLMNALSGMYSANGALSNGGGWNATTSPGRQWANYLKVGATTALPSVGLLYYDWAIKQSNLDASLNTSLNAVPPPPYTPIGQLFHDGSTDANGFSYDFSPSHIGTDCVGFAENSVSYNGGSYKWNNKLRNYPFPGNGLSVKIASWSDSPASLKTELATVIPGDIFYYGDVGLDNIVNNGHHVGIVLSSDSVGTLTGIKLIEAYFNGPVAYVNNERSLFVAATDINGNLRNWEIVRLQ
jgi:hypothetical protein